eukprot:SAG22_NODE_17811_length_298_cov_0.733668_1_plen_34_part_01
MNGAEGAAAASGGGGVGVGSMVEPPVQSSAKRST